MVARLSVREAERLGLGLGLGEDPAARRERIRRRGERALAADAPQAILLRIAQSVSSQAQGDYRPLPGRRYRADVAIPAARLIIECDGWEHHGKYKGDFERDRKRDRVLSLAGWRVLRFTAGEIRKDRDQIAQTVRRAVEQAGGRAGRSARGRREV
ncbi:MAG: hypothetical protein B7Z66_12045 [Chromatiales bacterium 21-64-14]|nr:MAG: hypothetical protein B7Z66_12045 [Chromatiales bacterium 21-64-14]